MTVAANKTSLEMDTVERGFICNIIDKQDAHCTTIVSCTTSKSSEQMHVELNHYCALLCCIFKMNCQCLFQILIKRPSNHFNMTHYLLGCISSINYCQHPESTSRSATSLERQYKVTTVLCTNPPPNTIWNIIWTG